MTLLLQLGWILLVGIVYSLSPLSIIWALNTLFMLAIPYTVWTWVAAVIIWYVLSPTVVTNSLSALPSKNTES